MDKTGDGFNFLKTKFPRLSEAKIKEGIFVGRQIIQLFKDSTFMKHLNRKEKRAWWQNTAGHWYEKLLLHGTRGKQAPDEVFVVEAEAVGVELCFSYRITGQMTTLTPGTVRIVCYDYNVRQFRYRNRRRPAPGE
ncbi:hypothetical protein AVEN_128432-1 [Araneus ventricosus]|uniref:Uncharacterized protein n=1 Tax=Araneus ventricosus TaxID=182803 RepID=A0A4Y2GJC5_ARAVE|nr:hypothetical protein AVEN_128432-1 [Araneus ventricosus]